MHYICYETYFDQYIIFKKTQTQLSQFSTKLFKTIPEFSISEFGKMVVVGMKKFLLRYL